MGSVKEKDQGRKNQRVKQALNPLYGSSELSKSGEMAKWSEKRNGEVKRERTPSGEKFKASEGRNGAGSPDEADTTTSSMNSGHSLSQKARTAAVSENAVKGPAPLVPANMAPVPPPPRKRKVTSADIESGDTELVDAAHKTVMEKIQGYLKEQDSLTRFGIIALLATFFAGIMGAYVAILVLAITEGNVRYIAVCVTVTAALCWVLWKYCLTGDITRQDQSAIAQDIAQLYSTIPDHTARRGVSERGKEQFTTFRYEKSEMMFTAMTDDGVSLGSERGSELMTDGSAPQCPLCNCGYVDGDTLCLLPCQHVFHHRCINRWCRSHIVCPLCKRNLEAPEPLPMHLVSEEPLTPSGSLMSSFHSERGGGSSLGGWGSRLGIGGGGGSKLGAMSAHGSERGLGGSRAEDGQWNDRVINAAQRLKDPQQHRRVTSFSAQLTGVPSRGNSGALGGSSHSTGAWSDRQAVPPRSMSAGASVYSVHNPTAAATAEAAGGGGLPASSSGSKGKPGKHRRSRSRSRSTSMGNGMGMGLGLSSRGVGGSRVAHGTAPERGGGGGRMIGATDSKSDLGMGSKQEFPRSRSAQGAQSYSRGGTSASIKVRQARRSSSLSSPRRTASDLGVGTSRSRSRGRRKHSVTPESDTNKAGGGRAGRSSSKPAAEGGERVSSRNNPSVFAKDGVMEGSGLAAVPQRERGARRLSYTTKKRTSKDGSTGKTTSDMWYDPSIGGDEKSDMGGGGSKLSRRKEKYSVASTTGSATVAAAAGAEKTKPKTKDVYSVLRLRSRGESESENDYGVGFGGIGDEPVTPSVHHGVKPPSVTVATTNPGAQAKEKTLLQKKNKRGSVVSDAAASGTESAKECISEVEDRDTAGRGGANGGGSGAGMSGSSSGRRRMSSNISNRKGVKARRSKSADKGQPGARGKDGGGQGGGNATPTTISGEKKRAGGRQKAPPPAYHSAQSQSVGSALCAVTRGGKVSRSRSREGRMMAAKVGAATPDSSVGGGENSSGVFSSGGGRVGGKEEGVGDGEHGGGSSVNKNSAGGEGNQRGWALRLSSTGSIGAEDNSVGPGEAGSPDSACLEKSGLGSGMRFPLKMFGGSSGKGAGLFGGAVGSSKSSRQIFSGKGDGGENGFGQSESECEGSVSRGGSFRKGKRRPSYSKGIPKSKASSGRKPDLLPDRESEGSVHAVKKDEIVPSGPGPYCGDGLNESKVKPEMEKGMRASEEKASSALHLDGVGVGESYERPKLSYVPSPSAGGRRGTKHSSKSPLGRRRRKKSESFGTGSIGFGDDSEGEGLGDVRPGGLKEDVGVGGVGGVGGGRDGGVFPR